MCGWLLDANLYLYHICFLFRYFIWYFYFDFRWSFKTLWQVESSNAEKIYIILNIILFYHSHILNFAWAISLLFPIDCMFSAAITVFHTQFRGLMYYCHRLKWKYRIWLRPNVHNQIDYSCASITNALNSCSCYSNQYITSQCSGCVIRSHCHEYTHIWNH